MRAIVALSGLKLVNQLQIKERSYEFHVLMKACQCTTITLSGDYNKPKQPDYFFGFTKQTETQPNQILFRFVSVRTNFFVSRTS
jgi:hypothetical protein